MNIPHIGEILSVLAALIWAASVVLFRLSGRAYRPLELNFFKNLVGAVLFGATFVLMRGSIAHSAPLSDYLILFLSGVLGITVGDTLFFRSLNIVGAGLSQIASLSFSPFVILFTFTFLGERLTLWDFAGALLILVGILLSAARKHQHVVTRHELRVGIGLATAAMAVNALSITIAKPVLDRSPVLWSAGVRLASGIAALMLLTLFAPRYRHIWRTLRPSPSWKTAIPAAVLGTYLAMVVWVAGMKFAQASTASILNQTSAVFVLPLAALVLHEKITALKLAAVALATLGVCLVTLA